jgi:tetratricopeptide (TPR) repeat protein
VELNPRSAVNHYNLGRALEIAKSRDAAIDSYREALRLDPNLAEAYCYLHRVLRDTGRYAEALDAIEQGHRLGSARPDWRLPSGAWLNETRRAVEKDKKLPAVLDGREKPATVHEQLEYAFICRVKSLYAASARMYAGAFATEPKPATALGTNYRYQAACAAALAGTAEGKDDPKPDAAERARWRKKAVEWLRADLALWADRVKTPSGRSSALTMLMQWRRDKALAGIREPAELAKLPEPERADYIRFWGEVQELFVRCIAGPSGK